MTNQKQLLRKVIAAIKSLEIYTYLEKIIQNLNARKIGHYFVGGTLRDIIIATLRHKKDLFVEDFDIVLESSDYNEIIKVISSVKFGINVQLIQYPQFLTLSIFLQSQKRCLRIDLSLPRKEKYPYCGALPVVDLGNINEDLFRRDFTINAIALRYNVNAKQYYFYDPFYGIEDILKKHIRIMHEKSFVDDPTRIIRGIRFAAKLKFKFDPWTENCMKEAIQNGVLKKISHKRFVTEFVNILRKGENLHLLSKMFKKFKIDDFYKDHLGNLLEIFHKYCKEIELKTLCGEDKFYIRLLYLLEKLIGKVSVVGKNKATTEFKRIMVNLELKKSHRQPIFQAIQLLSQFDQHKKALNQLPSWLATYVKLFY